MELCRIYDAAPFLCLIFDTVSKSVSEMNQKRAGTCMPAPKFVI